MDSPRRKSHKKGRKSGLSNSGTRRPPPAPISSPLSGSFGKNSAAFEYHERRKAAKRPSKGLESQEINLGGAASWDDSSSKNLQSRSTDHPPGAFVVHGIDHNGISTADFGQDDEGESSSHHRVPPPPDYAIANATTVEEPSYVYPTDTVDVSKEELRQRKARRRLFCLGFASAAILLGIGLGVGLGLGLRNNNGDDGTTMVPSASPSMVPSSSPTLDGAGVVTFISQFVTDPSILEDSTTPQGRALDWLLDNELNPSLTFSTETLQRFVLAVVFFSTNGQEWVANRNWLSSRSVCDWTTMALTSTVCTDDGLLQQLDLNRNNLNGTIPSEIGLLSETLTLFDLSFNTLLGTIPTELGQLSKVERFWVEANLLENPIPKELGNLTSVASLYLNGNNFVGVMPEEICTLRDNTTVVDPKLVVFWSDCLEVSCPCCSRCCQDDDPCNLP